MAEALAETQVTQSLLSYNGNHGYRAVPKPHFFNLWYEWTCALWNK